MCTIFIKQYLTINVDILGIQNAYIKCIVTVYLNYWL